MPLKIGGRSYPSISDLATATQLSTKTLKSYIDKGILPAPTKLTHGMREFSVFPNEYIEDAVRIIKDLARSRRTERRGGNAQDDRVSRG